MEIDYSKLITIVNYKNESLESFISQKELDTNIRKDGKKLKVYQLHCKNKKCNKKFLAPHNSYKWCPICSLKINTFKCNICKNSFIDNGTKDAIRKQVHICKKCYNNLKGEGTNILLCNHLENHLDDENKGYFLSNSPNGKNKCPICFSRVEKCALDGCNNKITNIYIHSTKNHFCCARHQRIYNSHLRVERNTKPGICIKCLKFNERRDAVGFGVECGCSKENSLNNFGENIYETIKYLWVNDIEYRQKCLTHGIVEYRYCDTCDKETLHNGIFCCICNEESKPGNKPNFIARDNVKTYKEIPVDYLVRQILNKEVNIEDYPVFEIRCGHVCYNCRDIITNEFISMKSNFNIVDGRKFYKNEPVEIVCEEILNKTRDINDYPGFEIRCGRVCYYTIDILTDEPIYLDSNFNIIDEVKFYKNTPVQEVVDGILNKTLNINDYPGFNVRLGRVYYGTHDILTDETIYLQQNFQIMDGVRFYKNEPVEIVIKKLESGEYNTIDNCPGWNKRFGEWYYGTVNVLTGEITTLNGSNFETKNDVLYYYDVEIGDYVPWDKFRLNFENKRISNSVKEFQNLIQNDYLKCNDVFIQSTFRNQDSIDWDGKKQAFERNLIEKNINWFVYIKFYRKINDINYIKPLVAGKSGSLLVNESGSDVNFSENIEDGPARRFLYENKDRYTWDKEEILIITCKSEEEALRIEKEIQDKYKLFKS